MEKIVYTLVFIICALGATCQNVQIGKSKCAHCTMVVNDLQFAAFAEVSDGNILEFDATECLINFLKGKDESNFEKLLVADYARPGSWVNAQSATYLKSDAISSPMGAYLSSFAESGVAEKVQKLKGGELYSWSEIKVRFESSRFGLINHPDHHHARPDAYAPIGIMGDHVHHQGRFMLSMRYMHMNMDGNINGTHKIPDGDIHKMHMVSPRDMSMNMYMLGLMYAPSDRLTLMYMQTFIQRSMNATTRMGMDFTTGSAGLGDSKISILYSLMANEKLSLHLNSGLSIPQGKVSMRDDTPMSDDMKLPYPMQLGSGTIDVNIGATFRQSFDKISWGIQPIGTIRTGENKEGYRLGHELKVNTWGAFKVNSWISLSGRIEGVALAKMDGSDNELNAMMSPAAVAYYSGFTKFRSFVGYNLSFSKSAVLQNLKLGMEYGLPFYQKVNGIQMEEQATVNAGIRYLL